MLFRSATIGDDAHGVLAQSIGGGGGWASGICSNSASSGFGGLSATRCIGNTSVSADVVPWSPGGALSLNMPGSTGNSGNGGAVSVNLNGASKRWASAAWVWWSRASAAAAAL